MERDHPWASPTRYRLAVALSKAGPAGMTPRELASHLGRRTQNVASSLESLTTAGFLNAIPGPPRPHGRAGHWPKKAYVLTPAGRAALESEEHRASKQPALAADAGARDLE